MTLTKIAIVPAPSTTRSANKSVNNDRPELFVGVEASPTECVAVRLDAERNIAATETASFRDPQNSIDEIAEFIKGLRSTFGEFDRVGVAVPGLIRRDTGEVAYSTQFPMHSGTDIAGEIRSRTGIKVAIENDANAAAYGEYKLGAGRDSRHMFYATIGSGVGGAFIIDGRVWHGAAGFAGEFGYLAVNSDGLRLEDVASSANIVRRTRYRFHQDNTSMLNRLEEQSITITDILSAAAKEDDFARLMLQRTGAYVGTAVANVINLLNIETIVIGGQIMQAGSVMLDAIVRSARELSFRPSFESTRIFPGELGANAAAAGAALLAAEAV